MFFGLKYFLGYASGNFAFDISRVSFLDVVGQEFFCGENVEAFLATEIGAFFFEISDSSVVLHLFDIAEH